MKRVGGRPFFHDQPFSSPPAHSEATLKRPLRHTLFRKTWSVRRLAVYIFISMIILVLLLYTWDFAATLFTPLLHSFEFNIYERDFGQNVSRPRITRHGRNILKSSYHPHGYDEPLGHPAWVLHGPEGGSTASLFYIIMEVGTGANHKQFFVDIDTGSSLTWLHCRLKPNLKSCKQGPNGFYEAVNVDSNIVLCNEGLCSLVDDYRDPRNCNDADPDYCQYDLTYADNLATRGVIVKDSVGLTLHSQKINVELAFGCGYEQAGCEYEFGPGKAAALPADGIIGLSKKPSSIPSQLHAQHFIRHLIGHCFLPFHRRSGTHVGVLLLGESDMTTRGIRWATMVDRESLILQSAYEGEMVLVKYGNRLVASFVKDHPERFVTFDSGTSMIWLTKDLFLALHAQVSAEAGKIGHKALPNPAASGNLAIGGPRCWQVKDSLKEVPFRHFKDITFGFTPGLSKKCITCVPSFFTKSWPVAKFVMPPSNYLTLNGNDADVICLALYADETYTFQTFGGEVDTTIAVDVLDWTSSAIITYALKGLVFVVDNEMHRIGWRNSDNCQ